MEPKDEKLQDRLLSRLPSPSNSAEFRKEVARVLEKNDKVFLRETWAATALWIGWAHLLDYLLYASILGGVLTVGLIEFRKFSMPSMLTGKDWAERLHKPGGGVPYGIALAVAALVVYPSTIWMQALHQ